MTRFAKISPADYDFFLERVELRNAGEANRAIERWKALQDEGWDVEALGSVDGSHMIGLGCRYPVELTERRTA